MLIILASSAPQVMVMFDKLVPECGGGVGEVGGGGRVTPPVNSRLIGDPPIKEKQKSDEIFSVYTQVVR